MTGLMINTTGMAVTLTQQPHCGDALLAPLQGRRHCFGWLFLLWRYEVYIEI